MQVVFDNIIFALQRVGGISVVWQELLSRALKDNRFDKKILDYPSQNVCRQELDFSSCDLVSQPLRIAERYRTPDFRSHESAIFHSSYFRIAEGANIKNITTVHDLTYHYYRSGLPRRVHLWEEQRALRHSAGIICVSEHTKRDLLQLYPWLDHNRIAVVYNGVGAHFCQDASVEKKGYLLFVGNRSAAYKRFDVAVEVARLTGISLVMVGGALSADERKMLDEQLGTDRYHAYTDVSNLMLNTFYNEALCLLYPSDYEGFGIPILEAQKAGCPVLCQATSSIPEVIGESGIMLPAAPPRQLAADMADIVRQLLSGQIDSIALTEQGKTNAARFSWDKTYQQTYDFYQTIFHTTH